MKHQPFFALLSVLTLAPTLHAQWEPDVRLTFNDSSSNTDENGRCIAAVHGGTVHVVWFDKRDGKGEIYYKRTTDWGVTWGPDTRLTFQDSASVFPTIATTGSNVHVVWADARDNHWQEIYHKRSTDAGLTWSQDLRLTYNDSTSCFPSVSASDTNIQVIWTDTRDGKPEVYHKRSADGGITWSSDARLSDLPGDSWAAAISQEGSEVHLIWHNLQDYTWKVYYRRSTDGGINWGPTTRLSDSLNNSYYPTLSTSGPNLHLAWVDGKEGNDDIYFKRSTNSGVSWSPDTHLTNDTGISCMPCISTSGGNIHISWFEYYGSNCEIFYKHSIDYGATWLPEVRLTYDPYQSINTSISCSDLAVHVLWVDSRDGNYEIYYKRDPMGNIGVEENMEVRGQSLEVRIKPIPNPFASFATIPGHEGENFALYDISARLVGTYRGNRIGENLPPGVYFLRGHNHNSPPIRVVKVR